MEVHSINHLETHAIVGGGEAQTFGIDDTPEFYEMLSATMYSNKPLAMIREVLCNAWDAHIAAGLEHLPIEIKLSDTELSIKDFGLGLSTTAIVPIYCRYGSSSKKHDGKQTGGFGLGSKAPFAYSKHFTVVSCHDGVRTIYAATRGTTETKGKPDFRPIVSVPTDETGITVSVAVNDTARADKLKQLIKDIVFEGGMRATLNGALLERIDYENAEQPFVVLLKDKVGAHHRGRSSIFVRYGAVVYDVSQEEEIVAKAMKRINEQLTDGLSIILLAEPNTIGVTPSRESLSYTDMSIETLSAFADTVSMDFMNNAEAFEPHVLDLIKGQTAKLCKGNSKELFIKTFTGDVTDLMYNLRRKAKDEDVSATINKRFSFAVTKSSIAAVVTWKRYQGSHTSNTDRKRFNTEKLRKRVSEVMRQAMRRALPKMKRYFNRIEASSTANRSHDANNFGQRIETMDQVKRLLATIEKRFAVKPEFVRCKYREVSEINESRFIETVVGYRGSDLRAAFAGMIPVITTSKTAVERLSVTLDYSTREKIWLILRVSKASDVEGATAFLTRCGFDKIHDARSMKAERKTVVESQKLHLLTKNTKASSPEFDGTNAKCYVYGSSSDRSVKATKKVLQWVDGRIEVPEDENLSLEPRYETFWSVTAGLPREITNHILDLFGDLVVVNNSVDAKRAEKAGLVNVYQAMADLCRKFANTSDGRVHLLHSKFGHARIFGNDWGMQNIFNYLPKSAFDRMVTMIDPVLSKKAAPEAGDASILAIFDCFATPADGTGRLGLQHLTVRLNEITQALRSSFNHLFDVMNFPDLTDIIQHIRFYNVRNINTAILEAMIFAAFDAARLQIALKPKEIKAKSKETDEEGDWK